MAGIVRKRIEVEFSNVAACALGDDAFTLSSFGIAGPQRNFNKPYLGLNPWQAGLAAVSLFLLALGAWNKSTKKRE